MTSVKNRIDEESRRDPDTLEREAEAARREVAHTVDLLEERLSPGQLLDRALNMGREHGGEFASNLGRSIKYHPVPLMLTAIGITWLAMAENRPPPRGDGEFSERAHQAGDAARSAMSSAREKAGNISERMQQSADSLRAGTSRAVDSLRGQSTRVRQQFEHTLQDQPLVLGALGIALGAILGGMLPRSQYEDRTIGQYGDRLREQASGAAEGAREAATKTVRDEPTQARH